MGWWDPRGVPVFFCFFVFFCLFFLPHLSQGDSKTFVMEIGHISASLCLASRMIRDHSFLTHLCYTFPCIRKCRSDTWLIV